VEIHVRPGSRADRVGGDYAGALVVCVRARAVDGAANDAVTQLLARALDVPERSVSIVRGRTARRKLVDVVGDDVLLEGRLAGLRTTP
jgi:hypothetical protein